MIDTPKVSNILSVYNDADADTLREGLSWYLDAHNVSRTMGARRDVYHARNAGIIAALSPNNSWTNNKAMAQRLISMRGRVAVEIGKPNGIGIGANVLKAVAIYNGAEPLDVLGGFKVRAFYETILDPFADIDPVIDRHAFDIAVGKRHGNMKRDPLKRRGVYAEFAKAYRIAAREAGISPAQMQAVTWTQWRKSHGIA